MRLQIDAPGTGLAHPVHYADLSAATVAGTIHAWAETAWGATDPRLDELAAAVRDALDVAEPGRAWTWERYGMRVEVAG